ncbi:hypothetical protein SSX86_020310 [Deinandra increscens subsp. villosa]|uniref:Cysteine proteinase inhibitor n=1 Tax=Deinandra increscens subsp. villosa TaxID=3103831 RepID=A0AAP0CMQ7_9ASTR
MATLGGITDAKGTVENSLEIDNLARFAVDEHNKKQQFCKVISTKEQVVGGMMYYITLEATDGGENKNNYEAKVWVKPWLNFKELQSFELLHA